MQVRSTLTSESVLAARKVLRLCGCAPLTRVGSLLVAFLGFPGFSVEGILGRPPLVRDGGVGPHLDGSL